MRREMKNEINKQKLEVHENEIALRRFKLEQDRLMRLEQELTITEEKLEERRAWEENNRIDLMRLEVAASPG